MYSLIYFHYIYLGNLRFCCTFLLMLLLQLLLFFEYSTILLHNDCLTKLVAFFSVLQTKKRHFHCFLLVPILRFRLMQNTVMKGINGIEQMLVLFIQSRLFKPPPFFFVSPSLSKSLCSKSF